METLNPKIKAQKARLLRKHITQARNAVKNAGNQIAEAHALTVGYDLPCRSIIGHLRDLNDALYGLAIYCQHEVEQAGKQPESLSQVMERTKAKKCFVVPTRERMAQEGMDVSPGSVRRAIMKEHFQALPMPGVLSQAGAPCPKCDRQVPGRLGALNTCECGAFLRRADTGDWCLVGALPDSLSAPVGRVPMTDHDRQICAKLQSECAAHSNYEWVWDAPPLSQPEWTPVVGSVYNLSNGNVAYLFDAGPEQRNLERTAEGRLLKNLGQKFAKNVRKERIKRLRANLPLAQAEAKATARLTKVAQQRRDAALKKRIAKHLPVHKTCASWGETQCGKPLLTGNDPVTVYDWKRVTCPECLAGAPKERAKGVQQRKDAAKLKLFVDTGDVPKRWMEPQPNHPSRFYLIVNGATKKNPKGNGYFTIEQARRIQKKLKQQKPDATVTVAETYLRR